MHIMSFCGHTADAMVKRELGGALPRKQLRDELVMAALYFPFAPLVYLYPRTTPKRTSQCRRPTAGVRLLAGSLNDPARAARSAALEAD
jgi:hypothetical protein